MKFATSRFAGSGETDPSGTVWLRRARLGAKRPGDLLVVVLSAGVVLTLGLVVVIARFDSNPAEPSSRVAAVQQPVQQPVMRTSPAAQAAPPPVALPAEAPAAVPQAAPRVITPVTTASVPTPNISPAPVANVAPVVSKVQLQAQSQPQTPAAPEPATPAAGAARSAKFDPALAFAAPTFPTGAMPQELESQAAQEPAQEAAQPAPMPLPSASRSGNPAASQRVARLDPEAATAAPARPPAAAASAGAPVAKKGGEGATWAVYFDQFPDQSTAASRIGSLQGKYGPHLGGRRLTYSRSGEEWRLRVSGLTEDVARGICDKVKSAGSSCAVGGR